MKGATRERRARCADHTVSIHAPNEGSDHVIELYKFNERQFQSTLPMKGATSV